MKNQKPKRLLISRKIQISILIFFFIIIGLSIIQPATTWTVDSIKHFYYFNINPKAQAYTFEKEYKDAFDVNQNTFTKSNKAVTDMVSGKRDFYSVEQDLLVNFNERNAYYQKLIKIDNDSLALNLPDDYKQFYKMRLLADKTDYEGFSVYRKGVEGYFEASEALQGFSGVYDEFLDQFAKLNKDSYSQEQVDIVKYHADLFDSAYKRIAGIADTTDIFNQEILNYIQDQYNLFTYTRDFLDGFENKDENKMNNSYYGMLNYLANNSKPDITGILNRWGIEKFGLVFQKQDKLHSTATNLYQAAYDFAKKQKLNDLFSIWGLNTPGYIHSYNSSSI